VTRFLRVISILLLVVAGCVTPVIPLPPPQPSSYAVTVDTTHKDTITISNRKGQELPALAVIFAFNLTTGVGVIQRVGDNGLFEATLQAKDGHKLSFWSSRNTDEATSEMACAVLDLPAGSTTGTLRDEGCTTAGAP
jgi:hypothetical protein